MVFLPESLNIPGAVDDEVLHVESAGVSSSPRILLRFVGNPEQGVQVRVEQSPGVRSVPWLLGRQLEIVQRCLNGNKVLFFGKNIT